ncbi:MAG TPA: phage tail protein [Candidatus Binataceae bacterium]|nr:phage tail protein [Candidatus Binataceae bacterium]
MFGTLGEIAFEVLTSPVAFEASFRWTYAEQDVVEARPRLQWLSEGLRTISFDLRFHASFTNPEAQLENLLTMARGHGAQALVLGNGEHLGYFVIVALRVASTQMTAVGDVIAMTIHLELKEWSLSSELDPTIPPQPDFTPIAAVPAPEGEETGAVTYSGALGVAATVTPATSNYVPTVTGTPGVTPLLTNPTANGATGGLSPDDVPTNTIVRSAAGN